MFCRRLTFSVIGRFVELAKPKSILKEFNALHSTDDNESSRVKKVGGAEYKEFNDFLDGEAEKDPKVRLLARLNREMGGGKIIWSRYVEERVV